MRSSPAAYDHDVTFLGDLERVPSGVLVARPAVRCNKIAAIELCYFSGFVSLGSNAERDVDLGCDFYERLVDRISIKFAAPDAVATVVAFAGEGELVCR